MEIRTRLTLQFIAVVAFILAISFAGIYLSSATYRRNSFYERLENKAITAAELLIKVDAVDSRLLKLIDSTGRDHLYIESISIYNQGNKLIYTNNDSINDMRDFSITASLLDEIRQTREKEYEAGDFEILGMLYAHNDHAYIVFAGAIDKFGRKKLDNLQGTLFALFFTTLIIVAFAGWVYSGRALAPISRVIHEVEIISPENLGARLMDNENPDEIGRLITTFNKLLERIDDAMKLQRLFVAGASHELKNPLTVITSQLEVSLRRDRPANEYKGTLASVLADIKNLNQLTAQLMDLARLSHGYQDIPLQRVRLDEVLWQACRQLAKKNPDFKIEQNVKSLPPDESLLYIEGNEALLVTAFSNLAENACKFSPDHQALISFESNNDSLNVTFADGGPGIDTEDLKLIYEPFFRSKNAASVRGHGVGLALVEKIIKLHKGEIRITSNPDSGTVFHLVFHPGLLR